MCDRGIEPLLQQPLDKRRVTGGAQLPRSLLGAHGEATRAQGVNGQCDGLWTSPAGASLMTIERSQQSFIIRVHWIDAQYPRDAETEVSGHLIFDQGLAYSIELARCQNIQQGRAGDQTMITSTVGQEMSQRLDAAVDYHGVFRQRQ